MTLRKAILKLADFDGWELHGQKGNEYLTHKSIDDEWCINQYISIDQLVAATKTLGYIIWHEPVRSDSNNHKWVYRPCWASIDPMGATTKSWLRECEKDEPAAIAAAFVAVVETVKGLRK